MEHESYHQATLQTLSSLNDRVSGWDARIRLITDATATQLAATDIKLSTANLLSA